MKSLTSHRVGLSKERMAMFEDMKPNNLDNDDSMPQYNEANSNKKEETNELDLLYKNIGKNFVRHNTNKTPGVYFTAGFILGVLFILLVIGIVALSSKGANNDEIEVNVAPKQEKVQEELKTNDEIITQAQEKYVIKSGDTLDKIVLRYYGKYSEEKIQEIQQINNIKNPARLQIGQEIIIPLK